MRTYTFVPLFFLACMLQTCQPIISTGGGQSELLSDGYISFVADGIPTIVHDSLIAGDPSMNLLYGSFGDSTLSLASGRTDFTIVPCRDTGIYHFSTWPGDYQHSSAKVDDYAKKGSYVTDSSLEGEFHLTRLDTAHGRIAGTFQFTARRFNSTSESDTIRVENGVVFDFPITVRKN